MPRIPSLVFYENGEFDKDALIEDPDGFGYVLEQFRKMRPDKYKLEIKKFGYIDWDCYYYIEFEDTDVEFIHACDCIKIEDGKSGWTSNPELNLLFDTLDDDMYEGRCREFIG
jgi:hypothetical protein